MMSTCIVKRVTGVSAHPDPTRDHLNVVILDGHDQLVSMKVDNLPRYAMGDLVVHLQSNTILPDPLLRRLDMWNEDKGRGRAGGNRGNRLVASKFGGVMSDGMMLPAAEVPGGPHEHGHDVAALLDVSFYQPPAG